MICTTNNVTCNDYNLQYIMASLELQCTKAQWFVEVRYTWNFSVISGIDWYHLDHIYALQMYYHTVTGVKTGDNSSPVKTISLIWRPIQLQQANPIHARPYTKPITSLPDRASHNKRRDLTKRHTGNGYKGTATNSYEAMQYISYFIWLKKKPSYQFCMKRMPNS